MICQVRKQKSIIEKQKDTYIDESMMYMQNSSLDVGIAEGTKALKREPRNPP
jgi:hypothetical protein